jgi:hypothetical protein
LPSSAPDLVMYIVSSTSAAAVPSCARYHSMGIPLWPCATLHAGSQPAHACGGSQ